MSVEYISKKRVKLHIFGIVQGVGFRPFVYQLARKYSLNGYVFNDGGGVVIEVEGEDAELSQFIHDLKLNSPSLARIDSIEQQLIDLTNDKMFSIIDSETTTLQTMVSPDISLCDECRAEMNDVNNRRYKYPFINCTNCGPRYTILNNLPYDRHNTSMRNFEMCDTCRQEYNDPMNRRYHAQPIGCYDCGPNLKIMNLMEDDVKNDKDIMKIATQYIKDGKTIAIKGLGGFHLICDATNDDALLALRLHKQRQKKPLAVMFSNIDCIKKVAKLSATEEKLIVAKERPIVVVQKNKNKYLSKLIAPDIDRVGVFLPYTPLHELLLQEFKKPLVATSANLSDEPIIRDDKELFKKLHLVVQTSLTHDREIMNACDDSVVMDVCGEPIFLRLSRGYAPKSFYLNKRSKKKILALGANQKNT
ncbi:MAG TPA: carbamoyltransferase HypF, partial [Arcobacter sp.]|nr:carbamoyltransferase HypF [Arcobacter sp.]